MFDVLDTAFFYPPRAHTYFFRGNRYIKYKPGSGVVALSGQPTRRLGVDGWTSLPATFRADLDAALFYPSENAAYFFRGDSYVKYNAGTGVEPLNGNPIRRIGIDGWRTLPPSFRNDLDAAFYYREREHAYFFKGDRYVKYKPGQGVVPLNGDPVRRISVDGWGELPASLHRDIDAVVDEPFRNRIYFFKARDYARWNPGEGLDERYPRRIGLLHGLNLLTGDRGGWPGLSHVIAGPLVGAVTQNTASLWIWVTDAETLDAIRLEVNGVVRAPVVRDSVAPSLRPAVDAVHPMSRIAELLLTELAPATGYEVRVLLEDTELDRVSFGTSIESSTTGQLRFVCGSCSDVSKYADAPVFERMHQEAANFGILTGDTCYYMNSSGDTSQDGLRPFDFDDSRRMMFRQVQARNHPQFRELSRATPLHATWDDHDFGHNNAAGLAPSEAWVGRTTAAHAFRAMWPNPYTTPAGQALHHTFRVGPVEVFMTDCRFHREHNGNRILGDAQVQWLINGLIVSEAPVKIVVLSTQFLHRNKHDSFRTQAPQERIDILAALPNVRGRVLFVTGDIHESELLRPEGGGPVSYMEFTSSPIRRLDEPKTPGGEWVAGTRVWAAKQDSYGLVRIDVESTSPDGNMSGSITIEAKDAAGNVIDQNGTPCRTVWNLATGAIA